MKALKNFIFVELPFGYTRLARPKGKELANESEINYSKFFFREFRTNRATTMFYGKRNNHGEPEESSEGCNNLPECLA